MELVGGSFRYVMEQAWTICIASFIFVFVTIVSADLEMLVEALSGCHTVTFLGTLT